MAKLTFQIRNWTDDHQTRVGEEVSSVLLMGLLLDGEEITYSEAQMGWVGPSLNVFPESSKIEGGPHDFLSITFYNPAEEVFDRYSDPADHLMGTSRPWRLSLAITEIEVKPA